MRFAVVLLGALASSSLASECPRQIRAEAQHLVVAQAQQSSSTASPESSASTRPLAQSVQPSQGLRLDPRLTLEPPPRPGLTDDKTPMFFFGDEIDGQLEDVLMLQGRAELRQLGMSLKADRIIMDMVPNRLDASGNVQLFKQGELYKGPALSLKLSTMQGFFEDVTYELATINGRGSAKQVEFLQPQTTRLTQASYTTCPRDRPAWTLEAGTMLVDQIREIADTQGSVLTWGGVPILPMGDISFAISDRRRTGFLPPSYAATTRLGLEVTAPFYWNMAPNRDMTLFPKLVGRRGVQLGTEFRYLSAQNLGTVGLEILPNDRVRGESRSMGSLVHTSRLSPNLSLGLNIQRVSDDDYFSDFGGSLLAASQRTLPATLSLNSAWQGWTFTAAAQEYQLLQDPAAPILGPYAWMPKLTAARSGSAQEIRQWEDSPLFDWQTYGELTSFRHPTMAEGHRSVAMGSISAPIPTEYFTLKPKVGVHATHYSQVTDGSLSRTQSKYGSSVSLGSFANNVGNSIDSYSRFVPTASLDASMVLERDTLWGQTPMMQTLEPRLFYVYTPYREQSTYPVFDAATPSVSLPQLLSDWSLSGHDRVRDQNQITAALTSRYLSKKDGTEILRGSLGQRFYFDDQRVVLPGETARTDTESDILFEGGTRLTRAWRVDTFGQYTRKIKRWQSATASTSYEPKPGQTISFSYRYTRNSINTVDLAFQMPVAPNWYAVGRYNYSLQKRQSTDITQQPGLIEALAGVEYDGGCWVARAVVQRFRTSAEQSNNAFFLQVELNGIARVGTNPLEALKRAIPNYRMINQLTPLPAQFENFQ